VAGAFKCDGCGELVEGDSLKTFDFGYKGGSFRLTLSKRDPPSHDFTSEFDYCADCFREILYAASRSIAENKPLCF